MIPRLSIRLLGEFLLLSDERPVTTVDLPRLQSLLAYLMLHHGAPQRRSRLASLFWPDTTDAQALSALRTAVHRLRQALPNADRFLRVDRHTLQWQPHSAEAESLAQGVQDAEFLGMARATSAWIAWRQGDLAGAQADGKAALACWRHTEVVHPFQWTALWPLIGAALSQNRYAEAVKYALALLAPGQQRLPDMLTAHVETAIRDWKAHQKEAAHAPLQQAISLAQTLGYL